VPKNKTTIRVSKSTKERLRKHGEMGMSYDEALSSVLNRLENAEAEQDDNGE
jgi:hypothetical protein